MHLGVTPNPRPATTITRCPKCRSRSFELIEMTEASISWTVTEGRADISQGTSEFGCFLGIECRCAKCGHGWKPRGKRQMPDVLVETAALSTAPAKAGEA